MIIDLTILSSLAKKFNKKPLKWNKAFYTSSRRAKATYNLTYTPYILGPEYIIKVATTTDLAGFQMAQNWIEGIDAMVRKMAN